MTRSAEELAKILVTTGCARGSDFLLSSKLEEFQRECAERATREALREMRIHQELQSAVDQGEANLIRAKADLERHAMRLGL